MKLLERKRGKVMLYESIKEMPIDLFSSFNKYLIQDLGLGSDITDVAKHFGTMYKYLGNAQIEEAAQESYNLYQNIFLMLERINIKHISFACFVHSINEVELTDYSETNLRNTCQILGRIGVTQGDAIEILEDLKKKLTGN